jgi:hypothetical protein
MGIYENAEVFFKCPVKDFKSLEDWQDTKTAYRLRIDWSDEEANTTEMLEALCQHKDAPKLKALVIGLWTTDSSDGSSEGIIEALVDRKDKLAGLRALFLGDIISEENEISWIQNSNVTPLLKAFPKLELFQVRGGNGLQFTKVKHESLRQLIVETGGLPRSVIREICRCEFPNLEHLELWLGAENYGWDGGVEDLQPILAGKLFPKLEYLGLRNSEIIDDIAPVVVNAPVLKQLKTLDLSNGNLSDVGAQALLNLPKDLPLKTLDISHHYVTEGLVKKLKKELTCKVIAEDAQEPDDEWRSIVVSE